MSIKLHEFLLIVLVFLGVTLGAFYFGVNYGRAVTSVQQVKVEQAIESASKAAQMGAADAISKIHISNTTVQGKVETIIHDNPVYRDCVHDDATLRLLNTVITGGNGSKPVGGDSLPAADRTH